MNPYKCGGAQQQAGLARCGLWEERRRELQILDSVSGVLRPGRMTLLLGPPASGKSTLLKALAGTLQPGRNLQVCPSTSILLAAGCPLGRFGKVHSILFACFWISLMCHDALQKWGNTGKSRLT